MKLPIIIVSDRFLKSISLFMRIGGIALFPFIIVNTRLSKMPSKINHETIHIKQQIELFIILFYVIYILEFIIKLFKYGIFAYENISFEREAYTNETNLNYLSTRKSYSFLKYL